MKSLRHHHIIGLRDALRGIALTFRSERNFRIHSLAAACVLLLGLILNINSGQWLAIALCIGLVMAAELFNTAIERLADILCPEYDPAIGIVKDIAAGAVLVAAAIALAVGTIIFIPAIIT